jgi:hypothetical protein
VDIISASLSIFGHNIVKKVLLRFVIGLLAEAIDFLVFSRLLALVTNVFGQALGVALRDPDAAAMKPVVTNIATNVKPKNMV